MIKTNDIKKGRRVMLRNGWEADICDNAKGNTRLAKVYGFETEMGSVYSHDIVKVKSLGDNTLEKWEKVEHTEKQIKLRAMTR
jgi:hypothetical protein